MENNKLGFEGLAFHVTCENGKSQAHYRIEQIVNGPHQILFGTPDDIFKSE